MKILMIAPEPFFEPRGTPISVYQRLEALSALGHEVDLLTYHVGQNVSFPNVRIHRVRNISFILHVRVGPSRAKILLDVLLFFKAFWFLIRNRYDVIHSHEESAFFCAPLAILFRTRHLYDMHSILPRQLGNFNFGNRPIFIKLFALMEKFVLKTCDAVITIGADIEDYVLSQNPKINQVRIENIALHAYQTPVKPEAIENLKEQLELDGRIPVVYTGTFEFYQGFEMVLECIPIVREQFNSVIFIFVGGKRNQANIWRRKAKEANVWSHTLFLDAVPPEESMVYLAFGEVLISPRLTGTSVPLKIYSYLHAGRPIVATNIDAHTQVLTPDIAMLVEPTKEAFARGIIEILRNSELGKCLGDNAHKFARENYNYQNYLARVNQIYRTLGEDLDTELRTHVLEE